MAGKFFRTCSVCCSMPPVIRFPVAGSKATWPEIKTNPLALMAWEYGPIALGALGVETTSRVKLINASCFSRPERISERAERIRLGAFPQSVLFVKRTEGAGLDLVQTLHIVNSRDLAQAADDALKVFHVFNIDHNINGGLAICCAGFNVPDICIVVADHGCKLLQHAGPVVAKNSKLHRICCF